MLRSFVTAIIAGDTGKLAGRIRNAALLVVLAGLCALAAVGFLAGAMFVAVSERFGTLYASLGFAAGFLAVSLLLLLVNAIQAWAWKRRQEQQRERELKALAATALLAALPGLMKSKDGLAGLIVPIIGLMALKIHEENSAGTDETSES